MCKERRIDRDSLALILENNDSGMLDYLSLRAQNTANQTFGNKNQTVINQTMPAKPTSSLPA